MSKKATKAADGILGKTLRLTDFEVLAADLKRWRTPELKCLEEEKGSGLVLGFVKGLRLSAGLIYAMRQRMSGKGLQVHWGHLLDPSKNSCSPECDVIIHKEGCYDQWNGHDDRVMDFKFIECEKAVAVISCKSFAKDVDKEYPRSLKPYIEKVILFAECCPPHKYEALRKKAIKAGYIDFCCLYTYDEQQSITVNLTEHWDSFITRVAQVADEAMAVTK